MEGFEMLPAELVELVLLFLDGTAVARVAQTSKTLFACSSGAWQRVLADEFPMTLARMDKVAPGEAYAVYSSLRRSVAQLDAVAKRGYVAPDEPLLAVARRLAFADRANVLLSRPCECGTAFVLRAIRSAATFRFVADEMRTLGRVGMSASIEYGAELIAFWADGGSMDVPRVCDARLDELAALCGTTDPSDPVATVRTILRVMSEVPIRPAPTESYYAPQNSYLHMVLTPGGRGIPIAFAVILHALARRLGVAVDLLNTRGHLICHVRGTDRFVDAFMGRIDTWEPLAATYGFEPEERIAVCAPDTVWRRMLRNLWSLLEGRQPELLALNASLTGMRLGAETAGFDTLPMQAWRNEHMEQFGYAHRPLLPRRATPPSFGRSVRVGSFLLAGPAYQRAVCVGSREPGVLQVLLEHDARGVVEVLERDAVVLDGSEGVPLENDLTGQFFLSFDRQTGRYVPNPETARLYPGDFAV
jgi:hypothetical protein